MFSTKYIFYTIFITLLCNIAVANEHTNSGRNMELLHFRHFDIGMGLPDNRVSDIAEDKNGDIWFSMMNGLCRFNGYTLKTYIPGKGSNAIKDNRASFLFLDKKGTLWLKSKTTLTYSRYRYDSDDFMTIDSTQVPEEAKRAFNSKQYDYITYGKWAWKRVNKKLTQYSQDKKDSIVYQGSIAEKAGLKDMEINAIYLSKGKKLWVGTFSNGVFFAFVGDKTPKTFLNTSCKSIRAICDDGDNGLFIGYDHWGVGHSNDIRSDIKLCKYPGETGKPTGRVRHLMIDSKGRLWIATICGIFVKTDSKGTFQSIRLAKDSNNTLNRIYRLAEDTKSDCVWAATWSGLARIDMKSLKLKAATDTTATKIHDIALDRNGDVWIASENGVYVRKGNTTSLMASDRICYAIDIASDGTVWCGTSEGTIYKRSNETEWHELPPTDASNACVKGLVCKGQYVYITTGNLLLRINNATLRAEMISSNEYDFGEGAYFLNKKTGEVLFGSEQGVLAIDSDVETPDIQGDDSNWNVYATSVILLSIGVTGLCIFIKKRKRKKATMAVNADDQPTDGSAQEGNDTPTPDFEQLRKNEFMEKAKAIMAKHQKDADFGVNEFANEMAMSRAQLFRKIKSATGLTPMDYIMSQRIEKAEQMLRTTTLSITEIAFTCGFNDAAAFRRNFQKIYGVTPSQYRNGDKT